MPHTQKLEDLFLTRRELLCRSGMGFASLGLANLRTRLRILHGNDSELELRRATSGAAEVVVTLPLREA